MFHLCFILMFFFMALTCAPSIPTCTDVVFFQGYQLSDVLSINLPSQRSSWNCIAYLSQLYFYFWLFIVCLSINLHNQFNIYVGSCGNNLFFWNFQGSVSVSMSIYQTLFCFICTHLTSGEKEENQLKRNADVNEIHRRTLFHPDSGLHLPKSIYDHE